MKVKRIYTQRVACQLIRLGHDLLRVENHLKYDHLKVFVFEETHQLLDDLTKLSNLK